MSLLPENFKHLNKYIAKAKQIEKIEPVVAYACRMYACQQALLVKNRTAQDNAVIGVLVEHLEATNGQIAGLSKEQQKERCESFALKVFDHADDLDRNPDTAASLELARAFHSAAIFMEIVKQFGEQASDISEKMKYSMWKAADITRAMKEGRQPQKGGFGESETAEVGADGFTTEAGSSAAGFGATADGYSSLPRATSSTSSSSTPATRPPPADAPRAPSYDHLNDTSPPTFHSSSASSPQQPSFNPVSASTSPTKSRNTSFSNSPVPVPQPTFQQPTSRSSSSASNMSASDRVTAQKDGERLVKHALSAIAFDDVETCVQKLQQALAVLQPLTNHG